MRRKARTTRIRAGLVRLLKGEARQMTRAEIVEALNEDRELDTPIEFPHRTVTHVRRVTPSQVSRVLQELAEEGYAHFDREDRRWEWLFAGGRPEGA